MYFIRAMMSQKGSLGTMYVILCGMESSTEWCEAQKLLLVDAGCLSILSIY